MSYGTLTTLSLVQESPEICYSVVLPSLPPTPDSSVGCTWTHCSVTTATFNTNQAAEHAHGVQSRLAQHWIIMVAHHALYYCFESKQEPNLLQRVSTVLQLHSCRLGTLQY